MPADFDNMNGTRYECVRCGEVFDGEQIALRQDLKCIHCGYHVLKKLKPPFVKRISTL
ncbi:MAG: hypothetical protein WC325_11620 [Candidatus Bathyarchaeia archaeon]